MVCYFPILFLFSGMFLFSFFSLNNLFCLFSTERDAFDTLFDHAPDKLNVVKKVLGHCICTVNDQLYLAPSWGNGKYLNTKIVQ